MRSAARPTIFALELHSDDPERLARFYEETLGIRFIATSYPFRRFSCDLGRFTMVIGDAKGHDTRTASRPGTATVCVCSPEAPSSDLVPYFLLYKRPLGGAFPPRHAGRIQDPDGNYLAVSPETRQLLDPLPPIRSFRDWYLSSEQFLRLRLRSVRQQLRSVFDDVVDRLEYASRRVLFVRRDIRQFTHLVGSREGLFAVNTHSYKKLLRGKFYGVTVKDGAIYCFQSCGPMHNGSRGRILRLSIDDGHIDTVEVVAEGLDDGCHQIDFAGDDLLVVDCYNGKLLQLKLGSRGAQCTTHAPFGNISRDEAIRHHHINSVAVHPDGTIWLMMHNGSSRHSEILVLDERFSPLRRFSVDAGGAHNIVFTNDESEYLIADSGGGRILSAHGVLATGDMTMLRGMSLDAYTCVVGDSDFGLRDARRYLLGRIHFFDRATWTLTSSLSLPAAPTEVRRIDGEDLSISNSLRARFHHRPDAEGRADEFPSTDDRRPRALRSGALR